MIRSLNDTWRTPIIIFSTANFSTRFNILQTLRLHLEGGYGPDDTVYRLIQMNAPRVFSSAIVGLVHNSFDDDQAFGGLSADKDLNGLEVFPTN